MLPVTRATAPFNHLGLPPTYNSGFDCALVLHDFNEMGDEATYICDACGEEIVVPVDLSAGSSQAYVEDCLVCCRPNLIHIEVDDAGDVRVWAERE